MPEIDLSNQTPLKTLTTGNVIYAGDFPVRITKVSGSNGVFSGEVVASDGTLYEIDAEIGEDGIPTGRTRVINLGRQISGFGSDWFDASRLDYEMGMVRFGSDRIEAQLEVKDKSIDPEKVMFISSAGIEIARQSDSGNSYLLSVAGAQDGSVQEIYALYPKENGKYYNLGKLMVDSRSKVVHKVVLVPLGGDLQVSDVRKGLNEIYGKIGISWNVSKLEGFESDKELVDAIFEEGSGILRTYNSAQKQLNKRNYSDSLIYMCDLTLSLMK